MKRFLSIIVAVVLTLAALVLPPNIISNALENACGDDVTWSFDAASGVLTLSGSGSTYSYGSSGTVLPWAELSTSITDLVVSEGITELGDGVFGNCAALERVQLPQGLKKIGDNAFKGCSSLSSINFPTTLTSVGKMCFANCSTLTDAIFTAPLQRLGDCAFLGCTSLANISLSFVYNADTWIGVSAFSQTAYATNEANWADNCLYVDNILIQSRKTGSLVSQLTLKEGTVATARSVFSSDDEIQSIVFPSSMRYISGNLFQYATQLTSVYANDGLEMIGQWAFKKCSKLASVSLPSTIKYIGMDAFSDTALYSNASSWFGNALYLNTNLICLKNYNGAFDVRDGTTCIATYAFNTVNVTTISLPPHCFMQACPK